MNSESHFFFLPFLPFFPFLPALRLASRAFSKLVKTSAFWMRGGISNCVTWVASDISCVVMRSKAKQI